MAICTIRLQTERDVRPDELERADSANASTPSGRRTHPDDRGIARPVGPGSVLGRRASGGGCPRSCSATPGSSSGCRSAHCWPGSSSSTSARCCSCSRTHSGVWTS